MTVFTVDVSSNQPELTVAQIKAAGFKGMMARSSIGSHYDSEYQRFMREAKALRFPFGAYHFLKGRRHTSIATQVATALLAIKDRSIPLMLDVESDVNSVPDGRDITDFEQDIARQGKPCSSIYLPHWYWTEIGRPAINLPLVASDYAQNAAGAAQFLYRGNEFWPAEYGGQVPVLWQFGSRGRISGYNGDVDINAYKGSAAGLVDGKLFTGWGTVPDDPKTDLQEDDMVLWINADDGGQSAFWLSGGKAVISSENASRQSFINGGGIVVKAGQAEFTRIRNAYS
jgi:lysozyme